jgi:nitrate reductase gamma subunit
MKTTSLRLSRPLYEGLPWIYLSLGLCALIVSYAQSSRALSIVVGVPGFVAMMAGIVLLLKRRDYRTMRMHYARPDALAEPSREDPF